MILLKTQRLNCLRKTEIADATLQLLPQKKKKKERRVRFLDPHMTPPIHPLNSQPHILTNISLPLDRLPLFIHTQNTNTNTQIPPPISPESLLPLGLSVSF